MDTFASIGKSHIELLDATGENINVVCHCPRCDHAAPMSLDATKFLKWALERQLIQTVWPEMDNDRREMLVSGICPTCWDKMFM